MLKVVLLLCLLSSSCLAWSHGQSGGQGGGANLAHANVFSPPYGAPYSQRTLTQPAASAADYYHTDGVYVFQPFDLDSMGTWGTAIHAAKGYRYVWLIAPDHPTGGVAFPLEGGWGNDANYIYVGFSNDPAIPPDPSTMSPILPPGGENVVIPGAGGTGNMIGFMAPWMVYNADDVSNHLYVYTQCNDNNGGPQNNSHETCLWKGNDFDHPLTAVGRSHQTTNTVGFTAFQGVFRTGVNTWVSYGCGGTPTAQDGNCYKWTSSDGATFTIGSQINNTSGNRIFDQSVSQTFSVSAQTYAIVSEDDRADNQGMYATMVPLDANGAVITTGTPPITRLSNKYAGLYPGPTYLQRVTSYVENGLAYIWALHGFFADEGLNVGSLYPQGGGLDQEYLDLYLYVVDSSAAVNAAPPGVSISAASGTVTISWYDVLPNHTYRVKLCTAGGSACSSSSTLGNPSNQATFIDTPTTSSSCTLTYYKVITLNSGTEEGSRIVGTFVSNGSAFVNKHITRACNAGADYSTIDQSWLATVDSTLNSNGLQVNLLFATDPAFGVVRGAGSAINQIMDLGTTRLPRGGDYTPVTPAETTYGATACNSSVPGWVNANTGDQGYYGGGQALGSAPAPQRLNQIRLKNGFSFLAAYQTSNTTTDTTLLASGGEGAGAGDGYRLKHIHGATPQAQWYIAPNVSPTWSLTDSKNLTGATAHIIGGTYDGTTATVYVEGVAGSGASPAQDISPQLGQVSVNTKVYVLNSGSTQTTVSTGANTTKSYSFVNNEALYTGCSLWVFDAALTSTQVSNLTTMIRNRIGP